MLADFLWLVLAFANHHFVLGMTLVVVGALLTAGGLAGIIVIRRRDLSIATEVPVFTPPTVAVPRPPRSHAAREDADTGVIPRIPGATPEAVALARWERDFEEFGAAITDVLDPGLRVIPHTEPLPAWPPRESEVVAVARPVCPVCGGPAGGCTCHIQAADCPLTTVELVVPTAEASPLYGETFTEHPFVDLGTQELSGSLARAKGAAR